MNCALEGHGIKVFGKAIHALSRVGDELWLDPMVKGLALRSVNSSQSAYACFFFSSAFFHNYSLRPEQACQPIKCRLYMKSLLPLFRCLTSIERNVERCQISVNTPNDRVMIQFSCKHGISKTHNLCYQESAALQAVFDSHLCPNVLKSSARLFASIIMHFQRPQEEVTLSITPLRVSLKSYHEGRNDHMKMLYTEMSLHPDEFDYFLSGMDSAVTFCLKELRFKQKDSAAVSDHLNRASAPPKIASKHPFAHLESFSSAISPVCFSVEDTILEATLVLATLIDSDSGEHSKPTENPGLTPPRCADAAVGANSPNIYAELEVVPSSQGSPINPSSPSGLLLQLQKDSLLKCVTLAGTASPASSTICHLLFRASSSEQDNQNPVATVLACDTDMEENE